MNKIELNCYASELFIRTIEENGYSVNPSNNPRGLVSFFVYTKSGKEIKIKVRSISQMGSYIFIRKDKFDIDDPYLYMAVAYITDNEEILYLIPATDWKMDIYPLKGKDYDKPGLVSEPEWGINYSYKAKDALEKYRFANVIRNI